MPDLPGVHNPRKTKCLTLKDQGARRAKHRLYPTNHPVWRRLRLVVLGQEPLCRPCRKEGRITPATEVDHIDGNDSDNRMRNLQPICKPCHARKTIEHDGGFGVAINRHHK